MSINALSKGLSAMQGYQRALDVSAANIASASGANAVSTQATMAPLNVNEGFDLAKDMVGQLESTRGFEFAAKLVQTADDMLGTLVNLDR